MSFLRTIAYGLARPVLFFYALPWLLILLVLGTVAQRYLGLYHSERLFFGSFILWIGPVPLPGAYFTLSLIALSLIAKLLLKSPIRKRSIGNIITHISVLILLIGGLLSAVTREEGYITLFTDDSAHTIDDYHDREMVILKNKAVLKVIDYTTLQKNMVFTVENIPFSLRVVEACYPCVAEPLATPDPSGYGMASAMKLTEALPNPDDSQNLAGAMVAVTGAPKQRDGVYIVMEHLTDPPEIVIGADHYTLEMRPLQRPLPFTVKLLNFVQENHPGTEMAREYRSDLQVTDGALSWKTTISMNQPLRYRGYTIYQSSFVDGREKQASVLAVVKNSGWIFPYLSIALLCTGLLIHLIARASIGRKTVLMALLFCCFASIGDNARAEIDYHGFTTLPVLQEGRIKPLDSLARALLKGMSGETHLGGMEAPTWLAQVIFDPAKAAMVPLFPIRSPELLNALSLNKNMAGRYSFNELAPALTPQADNIRTLRQRDAKSYTEGERELMHLYEMMGLYANLSGSLTLLMPLDHISAELRKSLDLPAEGEIAFSQLLKQRHTLMDKVKSIVAAKGSNIPAYTPLEQEMAHLAYQLDSREQGQQLNSLFKVIPGEWDHKEEWHSLWEVVARGETSPQSGELFGLWAQLMTAWQKNDETQWNTTLGAMQGIVNKADGARPGVLALEVAYNRVNPLGKAMLLYSAALLVVLAAVSLQKTRLLTFAGAVMLLALAIHGIALLARMIILARPPVSTLYESMIFVSFIAAFCGLFLSWRRKSAEGILAGSIVAVMVLYLADVFAGDGDTLEMLTAVLNTNFWLGTHVVCITAGYGFSLITGVMAHIYLFRRAMAVPREALASQYRLLHTLALVALFFTTTGTMLGGIWADQSWGRFWGWDPKENGALSIVIWLIWALHGRVAGQLRETAFASVLGLITIVVALAWVGVNLLSVGLHSYGFSSAAAWGLPIFCLTEVIIIGMLAMLSFQQSLPLGTSHD